MALAQPEPAAATLPLQPAASPGKRAPWERARYVFLLAIWTGLVMGTLEALAVTILYYLRRCPLDRVTPYLWTVPLSDAVACSALVIVFWLWALRRGVTPRFRKVLIFSLGAMGTFFTIIAVSEPLTVKLGLWAMVLLAGGVGVQAVRFTGRHPQATHRFIARSAPLLAALAIGVGLSIEARTWWIHRQIISSLPAAAPGAPNVLLIVMDTCRAKGMSLYGYHRNTTPHIDQWARRGVVFEAAVATSPFTLTSHASMFTGLYPTQVNANWTIPLARNYPNLAEALHARGYLPVAAVSNLFNAGAQTGLDQGFARFIGHVLTPGEVINCSSLCRRLAHRPPPLKRARVVNSEFLGELASNPQRPFFAFLNYNDCHAGYDPESPLDHPELHFPRRAKMALGLWGFNSFVAPAPEADQSKIAFAEDAYDACLQGLDRQVDALLNNLESSGVLKNTIVIIVGDHGEQFGEHRLVQHADSLYRPAVHVPLIILSPDGSGAGRRVHQMVTLRDLPATLLDLLNIHDAGIPGDSFAAALRPDGENAPLPATAKFSYVSKGLKFPSWHPNSTSPVNAVFLEGKQYITNGRKEEMYDFENDPAESNNLTADPASQSILQRCRALAASPPR